MRGFYTFLWANLGGRSAQDPIEAVRDSDIVVTCTAARSPLFSTLDLKPGCHVNAIGACRPGFSEVDIVVGENLKIFVDQLVACNAEAEELSKIDRNLRHFSSELGEVLKGFKSGRTNDQEITFFKSVGIAAQDLFAGELAYKQAIDENVGTIINFS